MDPIVPFEPISTERVPEGESWIAQIKWDGVRMLSYYEGTVTRLVNRRLNDRTAQYPELAHALDYTVASSIILDGELVAFNRQRPSFQEIMSRDNLRKADSIARAVDRIPVTYMVFDLLFYNGEWVTNRPLVERQSLLETILKPHERVKPVTNTADAEGLFEVMRAHGMEGVVCKDLNSRYLIGGKDKRWQKKKMIHDLIALVGGVTYGEGTGIVNSLLLGLYDDKGEFWYVGHSGMGKMTHADWRRLTQEIEGLRTENRPFRNRPEREREAVWLRPVKAVKVNYLEWTEGGALRQPSIQAFTDTPPEDCTFERSR